MKNLFTGLLITCTFVMLAGTVFACDCCNDCKCQQECSSNCTCGCQEGKSCECAEKNCNCQKQNCNKHKVFRFFKKSKCNEDAEKVEK